MNKYFAEKLLKWRRKMATTQKRMTAVQGELRILIVEDDQKWQEALAELYRQWFPSGRQTIVDSARAARAILRGNGADFVSLDLNLSLGSYGRAEPHGLKLLVELSKHHWARALCVITQMHVDRHLKHLLDDWSQKILERLKTNDTYTLNRLFGVNSLMLLKQDGRTPSENVSLFLQTVDAKDVKALLQHAFTLTFTGDDVHEPLIAKLTCQSREGQRGVVFNDFDAKLLLELAQGSRCSTSSVTDVDVARIYGLGRVPNGTGKYTPIHSLNRRLRQQGVIGLKLIERKTASWRLNTLIKVRGVGTILPRPGGDCRYVTE